MKYTTDFLKTEEYASARAAFLEKYNEQDRRDCTCLGFYMDNEEFEDDDNPQCHVGLTTTLRHDHRKPLAIFSGFQEHHKIQGDQSKLFKFWYEYQASHDILGKGVLNSGWKDAYDAGWVFRTDIPHDVLCAALLWTRWPSEFPAHCDAMKVLTEAGVHPDMAFLVSTITATDENGRLREVVANSHMPCPSHLPDEFVTNFLKHKVTEDNLKKPNYYSAKKYSCINGVFGGSDKYYYGSWDSIGSDLGRKIKLALLQCVNDDYKPSPDIFFTKEVWQKQLERSGTRNIIPAKALVKLVEPLNNIREEIVNG